MADARKIVEAHITRVGELGLDFNRRLMRRFLDHDISKYHPTELGPLQEMADLQEREGDAPFGSEEYERRKALLGPMLEHHYKHNSHHPEHYPDGVAGMDLLDLVEMFLDWKAASERGNESAMNLSHAIERYQIEPQLASILRNTADRLGFAHR